ncbi:protein-L-histidine N-pros-methyltransferase-like [Dreissena polymorpha]|uniref:Methyltransferase-like protein 9 n=1 Tax=Dreissena polymorpha TaxID=45954 RepID=A0A9D4E422_DREPO|nr:protein-L-histidine N-pros-methyltransferase-like [Dreissena polymorpha]KAH3771347.1 hypothetical protein DPMN_172662 [Dreissena polymorpha]
MQSRVLIRLYVFLLICELTPAMYSYTGRRGRVTLAKTIYNRMIVDEKHKADSHEYWYCVEKSILSEAISEKFVQFHEDPETHEFLSKCYEKADWVFTQLYHLLAKSVMSWFMENTSINGWLGRGSMFVLSQAQFMTLLNVKDNWIGQSMIDLGAGDGKVTEKMSPFFKQVFATETSGPMVTRLKNKGYRILDIDKWDNGSLQYDLVSCLNLLDRADKPVSILHSIKRVLKPGGRVLIALVLPFSSYVEFGSKDNRPTEKLNIEGSTFEAQCNSFVKDVFEPAGLALERFTRVPYLCEGDMQTSFYVLDDAVFVLKHKEES